MARRKHMESSMTNQTTTRTSYRTVLVPANQVGCQETLIEGLVKTHGVEVSTGLCRTITEAQERALALESGRQTKTQAPDYQANQREMDAAWAKLQTIGIRDGGVCHQTIEDAIKAGIHTVEWALASRYLVAGWL
jgi:hypothetical protein